MGKFVFKVRELENGMNRTETQGPPHFALWYINGAHTASLGSIQNLCTQNKLDTQ